MVLAELGQKIASALNKMSKSTLVGEEEVKTLLNEVSMALLSADVNIQIVKQLHNSVKAEFTIPMNSGGMDKRKILQQTVLHAIKRILDPGVKPFVPTKGKTSIVMFVGLQGAGKTTSITKYALYYQKKGFKVGLVCADTFRAGAYDQLKQNAVKAKVHFYGSMTEADPVVIAKSGVKELTKDKYDLILIDTSGRHKQEAALFDEMKQMQEAVNPNDIVYVMSATDGQAVHEQALQFKRKVPVGSVVVTKLDCNAKGGGALSAVAATQSPIVFIGTGEHMDDIEPFNPDSFLSKMMGMGDLKQLAENIKNADIDTDSEVYKRMKDGIFTMRDMYEHITNTQKLGPMNKLMEMVPGMANLGNMAGEQSQQVIKAFLYIFDSMTPVELDDPKGKKLFTPSRMARIARGSGRSPFEVMSLLSSYSQFEEVVKRMGKMNLKAMTQDPSSALGNNRMAQQQINQFARALNPQMLQKLGGMGGLQGMMKQFSKMK